MASTVATDMQAYLAGDATELPPSLRQLGRLLTNEDVQSVLRTSAATVVQGMASGMGEVAATTAAAGASPTGASALETVLEAMLSDRGRSLLGVAVGVASKNVSSSLCDFLERMQSMQTTAHGGAGAAALSVPAVLRMLVSEDGDKLLSLLITKSVGTAVQTYCDAYAGVNVYADMVDAIVKQEHRDAVSDVMARSTAAFCREVAVAIRRAQQQQQQQQPAAAASGSGPALMAATGDEGGAGRPSLDGLVPLTSAHSGSIETGAASPSAQARLSSKPVRVGGGMASAGSRHNARTAATTASATAPATPASAAPGTAGPSPWVRQMAELAREKEVRALAVDVVGAAMRESTRSVVESLSDVVSLPSIPPTIGSLPTLYVALAMACVLLAYVLGSTRVASAAPLSI